MKQNIPFSPRNRNKAWVNKHLFPMGGNCLCGKFAFAHFLFFWGCFPIKNNNNSKELLINEKINFDGSKEVRIIGADNEQLGLVSFDRALDMADDAGLDLVLIAAQAEPPVCRIMDYGKYCFEQQKREKEARKNQKVVAIKEIRMFSAIDTHDFETKVNQAKKFLEGGDKLKVSVRFRKRAIAHPQIGEELLERFKEACAAVGTVEKPAKMEGRSMVMFISPKASK